MLTEPNVDCHEQPGRCSEDVGDFVDCPVGRRPNCVDRLNLGAGTWYMYKMIKEVRKRFNSLMKATLGGRREDALDQLEGCLGASATELHMIFGSVQVDKGGLNTIGLFARRDILQFEEQAASWGPLNAEGDGWVGITSYREVEKR